MGIFTQLLHRPSTDHIGGIIAPRIDILEAELLKVNQRIRGLELDLKDLEERTTRRLDRYRSLLQNRKDGRFAAQDVPQSTNGPTSDAKPTHAQIEQAARKQGIIS